MPLVGPLWPGPAGEPLEPLPILPLPCVVGLVGVPIPAALLVIPEAPPLVASQSAAEEPPFAEADAALPAPRMPLSPLMPPVAAFAQSARMPGVFAPLAGAPLALCPCDAPEPDVPPIVALLLVEPPAPEPCVVFGSTALPEPMVREDAPGVLGVDVCAMEMPALDMSASKSVIADKVFMFPPPRLASETPLFSKEHATLPAPAASDAPPPPALPPSGALPRRRSQSTQLVLQVLLSRYACTANLPHAASAAASRNVTRRSAMPRIRKSIEVSVPVHALYARLARFEDYPRFMNGITTVRRVDDTHLHWTTRLSDPDRDVEWDAAITEQVPDRCIAWRNTDGPVNAGKVELEPAGPDASRVTLTLEAEPEQTPGFSAGNSEAEMSQRLQEDLLRLKDLVENPVPLPGRAGGHETHTAAGDANEDGRGNASYAAGSEGWDGSENPGQPVISASNAQADRAGEAAQPHGTRSDYSLPQGARDAGEDNDAFQVAEEVNLDEQSSAVRHVGQMPAKTDSAGPAEGMAEAMKLDEQEPADKRKLKESIERNVPPSG